MPYVLIDLKFRYAPRNRLLIIRTYWFGVLGVTKLPESQRRFEIPPARYHASIFSLEKQVISPLESRLPTSVPKD